MLRMPLSLTLVFFLLSPAISVASKVGDCIKNEVEQTTSESEMPVPLEEALAQSSQQLGISESEARSRLKKIPLLGPAIANAKAKIVANSALLSKILKDQIVTPLGLIAVNPHDPHFWLKWATLSPTRTYLVVANAGHGAQTGIKNVFDSGASLSERAQFLLKKCAVQGSVGLGAGAAVKTIEEALEQDGHQSLTNEARDVLMHSAMTGGYFFLTACIRYQTLDKLNSKVPEWLTRLSVPERIRDKSATFLLTSLYFGNAVVSAEIYGKVVQVEDLIRNGIQSKDATQKSNITVTPVQLTPEGTFLKAK